MPRRAPASHNSTRGRQALAPPSSCRAVSFCSCALSSCTRASCFQQQAAMDKMAKPPGKQALAGGKARSAPPGLGRRAALDLLATMEPRPLEPPQVAMLVSGSLLVCAWRFLSECVAAFDVRGMPCLVEMWLVAAASMSLGQVAKAVARHSAPARLRPAAQDAATSADSTAAEAADVAAKAAAAAGDAAGTSAAAATASDGEDEEDDVTAQKRRAQAEAAQQLAAAQSSLAALLAGMRDGGADDAQLLYRLADQLFSSPVNVWQLVQQGGVPVVVAAVRQALPRLQAQAQAQQQQQPDVLAALLQVSWVLLQVAHGPPACRSALAGGDVTGVLLDAARSVVLSPAPPAGKEAVLRNFAWALLMLCDSSSSSSAAGSGSGEAGEAQQRHCGRACALALAERGVFGLLQQLASLQHGVSPGWVAAAMLGLCMQHGQPEQQQQLSSGSTSGSTGGSGDAAACQSLCDGAVAAALAPDSLHGLAYLLAHRPQLAERLQALVLFQLHHLLRRHPQQLLRALLEQQLVGPLAAACPQRLGRLLVCQLLSSKGQEVMAGVEEEFELDVPLALAQIIPLPLHLKLPASPAAAAAAAQQQQQQQQQRQAAAGTAGEIAPLPEQQQQQHEQGAAGGSQQQQQQQATAAAGGGVEDDVYTDILACRLLLQHSRLDELLDAFAEELLAAQLPAGGAGDAAGAAGGAAAGAAELPAVVQAVHALVGHLMARDLELQAVQHTRGDSIDDSLASCSASSSASASASSSIESVLAAPDASGLYSSVLSGMVPAAALPLARVCGCSTGDGACGGAGPAEAASRVGSGLLTLPPMPEPAASAASASSGSKRRPVVFQFGALTHAVERETYSALKRSSKLVASLLGRQRADGGSGAGRPPLTLLATPAFTDEANLWVLRCLERWLATGQLHGFSAAQAAKLWVAADFLQVDGLQVACEDVAAAAFASDPQQLDVALELCARHGCSSGRLQRLAAQALLRGIGGGDAGGAWLARLQALLGSHRGMLLGALHAEVRDRLVALVMLNAGLDADTPGEDVG